MDIARPSQAAAKRRRRILIGAAGLAAVLLITLGLSRLKPAAPSVERATVLIDTVKRGDALYTIALDHGWVLTGTRSTWAEPLA
jgi:HlyD family secretion protein